MGVQLQSIFPLVSQRIYVKDGAVTTGYSLPDAHYIVQSDSFVAAANTALAATAWSFSIDANGYLTLTRAAGATTVEWYNPGAGVYNTYMRDILGFDGDNLAATTTAPNRSPFLVRLHGTAIQDTPRLMRVGAQAESDTGVYTLFHASKRYRDIQVLVSGNPRGETVGDEYYNCYDHAEQSIFAGLVVRYYPDTSITTSPFERYLNPMGYESYVVTADEFAPPQKDSGWNEYWLWSLRFAPATEPSDLLIIP